MKAKELQEKLDYIPRWAWYIGSLFIAPPMGFLCCLIGFHALGHAVKVEERREREARSVRARKAADARRQQAEGSTVRGDGYEVRSANTPPKPAERPRKAVEFRPIDPEAGVAEVLRHGREAMALIRSANDAIPDPILSAKIDSIEQSCGQILEMLEQRPELLPQLRTFLRYYLPTTLKLLDARARLDNANTPKGREVRRRIGGALDEIDRAFRTQIASLEEYRFVDLESEMDVLSEMLRADGLISEDEPEDRPQSRPLGGH